MRQCGQTHQLWRLGGTWAGGCLVRRCVGGSCGYSVLRPASCARATARLMPQPRRRQRAGGAVRVCRVERRAPGLCQRWPIEPEQPRGRYQRWWHLDTSAGGMLVRHCGARRLGHRSTSWTSAGRPARSAPVPASPLVCPAAWRSERTSVGRHRGRLMDVQIWTSEGSLAQEELRRAKARQKLSGGGQRCG